MSDLKFVKLDNDPPIIREVRGGPWPLKEYFDLHLKCGEVQNGVNYDWRPGDPMEFMGRYKRGCGASDWDVKRVRWYPSPGTQWELTCRKCKRVSAVEVREPIQPKE